MAYFVLTILGGVIATQGVIWHPEVRNGVTTDHK